MMKDEQNLKKILAKVYRQKYPKDADKPNTNQKNVPKIQDLLVHS